MESLVTFSSHPLERAGRWLLQSGIQEPEGGVARFYRSDLSRNNPVSTEITAYHASALIYLHHVLRCEKYLERAIATAHFLTQKAWNPGLRTFPFEYPHASPTYFFDCGIIIRGLLAVWRVTHEQELLDVATECGDSMLADFNAGFDFHPVLELPSKTPALRDPRWSRSSGCYQLKVALGWLELGEANGEARFQSAYSRMLEQAVQDHFEFLPGHADPAKTMDRLHAYCYFLEALLPVLPQPALCEGIQRVSHFLHTIAPKFARSDVYAQLLRMRIYAHNAGVLPLDRGTAAMEADALLAFQIASSDAREDGGFYFGRDGSGMIPHVNPVSTAFAVQALGMWSDCQSGGPLPDRRLLV